MSYPDEAKMLIPQVLFDKMEAWGMDMQFYRPYGKIPAVTEVEE